MPTTTPNIETIRRISILFKAKYCYLLIIPDDPVIQILVDIKKNQLNNYKSEIESWCGMKFYIFNNETAHTNTINNIKKNGTKILPIKTEEIKKAEINFGF